MISKFVSSYMQIRTVLRPIHRGSLCNGWSLTRNSQLVKVQNFQRPWGLQLGLVLLTLSTQICFCPSSVHPSSPVIQISTHSFIWIQSWPFCSEVGLNSIASFSILWPCSDLTHSQHSFSSYVECMILSVQRFLKPCHFLSFGFSGLLESLWNPCFKPLKSFHNKYILYIHRNIYMHKWRYICTLCDM